MLYVKNRKNVVDYIDRVQIVYNNIIEAEKSARGLLTYSDVVRINDRFLHAFVNHHDIQTLAEKRNDLSPIEI